MTIDIDVESLGFATAWFPPFLMHRPHRHNEVEINFMETGSISYLFGGARVSVTAGQMALFWATIPHQTVHVEENSVFHWVTIPFAAFLQWQLPEVLTRQVVQGKFVVHAEDADSHYRQQQFRQWNADLQNGSSEYRKIVLLEVEALLRRFALSLETTEGLSTLQEESNIVAQVRALSAVNTSSTLSRVELMASFIAEHYTEPLPIESIAQEVHLHPNYAMSLFRKSFGISIVDYITQFRVSHAQRLLVTTEANISEIALAAGFGSVSRFYTAFKAACGVSPKGYRISLLSAL